MKILLLAGTEGQADEGARNVSGQLGRLLALRAETRSIAASRVGEILAAVRSFKPDIVHSVHGPSPRTFALLGLLRMLSPRTRFFATLTQPSPGLLRMGSALRAFRFIHLFSQDAGREQVFAKRGFRTTLMPNGVDTERFKPVDPASALPHALASRLDPRRKLVMHVGHLKLVRGVETMAAVARANPDWQVLMVASKRFAGEPEAVSTLQDAGCLIYQDFVDDLPALYCRADAYMFAATDLYGSIDMPLTVLEAMACNRPVVSTPYKALPRFIAAGEGVHYFDGESQASAALGRVAANVEAVATREKALQFSWDAVVDRTLEAYRAAVDARRGGAAAWPASHKL